MPVLYGGQHTFTDWIADRFRGVPAAEGCSIRTLSPPRGYASADFDGFKDQTWMIQYNKYGI